MYEPQFHGGVTPSAAGRKGSVVLTRDTRKERSSQSGQPLESGLGESQLGGQWEKNQTYAASLDLRERERERGILHFWFRRLTNFLYQSSDERLSGLFRVAPPLAWDVGGDRVRRARRGSLPDEGSDEESWTSLGSWGHSAAHDTWGLR